MLRPTGNFRESARLTMPIITALEVQQGNKRRVNVSLDGQFAFGLAMRHALQLKKGQELSPAEILALQEKDSVEKAYERALNYLSYRIRSEAEMRQYLQKRALAPEQVTAVLERLREENLLNDTRFAESWVENRTTFRPRGQRLLKAELQQKGVTKETVEAAIAEVDDSAVALELAQKRIQRWHALPLLEQRQKLMAFLARRGFHYNTISEVVRKVTGTPLPDGDDFQ